MPNAKGKMTGAGIPSDSKDLRITVDMNLDQWELIGDALGKTVFVLDEAAGERYERSLPSIEEIAGIMDKPETSVIEWHRLPDKPEGGEEVILEIEGKRGRSNRVVSAVYWDDSGHWSFDDATLDDSVTDDRVVRWARFPEPSWKEVIE